MKVNINGMDHFGNGIGKMDEKVVFVPKCIPGDICEIIIKDSNKKFDFGRVTNIVKESTDRIEAACPYYDICGGCNISNLSYEKQLEFKKSKVSNIFKKYLDMNVNPTIIASNKQYKYRNKITYHNDKVIGLVDINNGIVPISKCLLISDNVNKLFNEIKKEDLSNVKSISIKEVDNGLILSITGKMDINRISNLCLAIYINDNLVYGHNGYIILNGIKYMVSNRSFFQINTSNITKLYDQIVKYGEFKKSDKVIDLYCGVGSISLYVSRYVNSVFGIEIINDAIVDAKENARINNITNAKFMCGDVSKLIDNKMDANIVIVDPPRVGLDNHTIAVLNQVNLYKIIYVSCDPMTLARDIKLLNNYELKDITLVDMFPQTHHVECVCVLKKL